MKNLLLPILLVLPLSAFANNEKMLGVEAGFSTVTNSDDHINKIGPTVELKGIYSIDSSNFNYDLGVGYHHSDLAGKMSPDGSIKIKTRAIFLEGDVKYKVTPNVYIGPGLKVLGGTDTTFKEREESNTINPLVGLKVQYDFLHTNSMNYRIEASFYSTTQNPQDIISLVGINFGFKEKDRVPEVPKTEDLNVKIAEKNYQEPQSDIKVVLKSARVLFKTSAYEVDPKLKEKLIQLAEYLNSDNSMWARIKISGHTDNKGSLESNKELSQKRADSIRNVLIEHGVDPAKVDAESYAYLRPIATNDTELGREKNRRTEVEFFGIKNRDIFNQRIMQILQ